MHDDVDEFHVVIYYFMRDVCVFSPRDGEFLVEIIFLKIIKCERF